MYIGYGDVPEIMTYVRISSTIPLFQLKLSTMRRISDLALVKGSAGANGSEADQSATAIISLDDLFTIQMPPVIEITSMITRRKTFRIESFRNNNTNEL